MRLVSYLVIYGIIMTKKHKGEHKLGILLPQEQEFSLEGCYVKRQICSVLAVKKVVYSTLIVSIFLTNIMREQLQR